MYGRDRATTCLIKKFIQLPVKTAISDHNAVRLDLTAITTDNRTINNITLDTSPIVAQNVIIVLNHEPSKPRSGVPK